MILLLILALALLILEAIPVLGHAASTLVGWISWGWAGLAVFVLWLILAHAGQLRALVQRQNT